MEIRVQQACEDFSKRTQNFALLKDVTFLQNQLQEKATSAEMIELLSQKASKASV